MRISTVLFMALCMLGMPAAQAAYPVDTGMLEYIQADQLQAAGLTGAGIKIGVISDGVLGIGPVEQDGTLPAVTLYQNDAGNGGFGVAMLQIVHQIAPAAQLYFCAGIDYREGECIRHLVNDYGVTVVTTDLGWGNFMSPDDMTAEVENLEAANPLLINTEAAGDNSPSTIVHAFIGLPLTIGTQAMQAMDFGTATGHASSPYDTWSVPPGGSIEPQFTWSDDGNTFPTPASNDVMGLWLLDANGNVLASGQSNNAEVELDWTNTGNLLATVRLVVGLIQKNNSDPLYISLLDFFHNTNTSYTWSTPGGILSPDAADPLTLSVGASAVGLNTEEVWSQQGPYLLAWSATQTGGTDPFGSPQLTWTRLVPVQYLQVPQLTGADFIGVDPTPYFPNGTIGGTSAAAPTVAGVAALLQEAGLTRAQIITSLEATARPLVTGQSADTWNGVDGYGLIQGYAALLNAGAVFPQPVITAPSAGVSITQGQSVSFAGNCTITGGATIAGYSWNFGGGATNSTQQNPGSVTFATPGSYTVAFNCTGSNHLQSGTPPTVTVAVASNTPPPSPPSGGKSGGGAMGFLILGLLAVLAGLVQKHLRVRPAA